MIISTLPRPNKVTDSKDEEYHSNWGRHVAGCLNSNLHQQYIATTVTHYEYFKGNQWLFDEDTELFLKDQETGNLNNRIQLTDNIIQPIALHHQGTVERMNISARARSFSPFAVSRRERHLNQQRNLARIANSSQVFGDTIKRNFLGVKSDAEAHQIHVDTYSDQHELTLNRFLKYMEESLDVERLKDQQAIPLYLAGINGIYAPIINGEYTAHTINPKMFGWDRSATKPDLTDASYWVYVTQMDTSELIEEYELGQQAQMIEEHLKTKNGHQTYVTNYGHFMNNNPQKMYVYRAYWRDTVRETRGYVKDRFGEISFQRINHPDSQYTDEHLVKNPDAPEDIKKKLGDKLSYTLLADTIRYCHFIPHEDIHSKHNLGDVVLQWGELEYSHRNRNMPNSAHPPFFLNTWFYHDGQVLAPVATTIDPQRMVNRYNSVIEERVSNANAAGTVIAIEGIDPSQGGISQMRSDINQGKTVAVEAARMGSVQNTIGQYQGDDMSEPINMFQLIGAIKQGVSASTAMNDGITGNAGGRDALGVVIRQQIEQGSIVHQPFYTGITRTIKDLYTDIANRAPKVYFDNEQKLISITGDEGAQHIKINRDIAYDFYRITIDLVPDREMQIANANQLLFTFMQAGLLDQKSVANLWGRTEPDEVARALRRHAVNVEKAKELQAQQQSQQLARLEQERLQDKQFGQQLEMEKILSPERIQSGKNQTEILKKNLDGQFGLQKTAMKENKV